MKTSKIYTAALILALVFAQATTTFAQSVGINEDGSEPDSRAILDVKSSDKGVLLPRLSDTERDELFRDVPFGMMIFNTTDSALQIFMDTAWYSLSMGTVEAAPESVTDFDVNIYPIVQIGGQVWMAENLKVTHYPDGTPIPHVTDNTAWENLVDNNTDDAYCYYNNNSGGEADTYGALYTWAAAMGDDAVSSSSNPSGVQGVCPDGWHLPSDAEWTELEDYLTNNGHSGTEGTALKATSGWNSGGNGTDDYGFSALPGGYRNNFFTGAFYGAGNYGFWWSATEYSGTTAWFRDLYYDSDGVNRDDSNKSVGFSVRCVRD